MCKELYCLVMATYGLWLQGDQPSNDATQQGSNAGLVTVDMEDLPQRKLGTV